MLHRVALLLILIAGAAPAVAGPRTELPIREVMLSDGARRYAVPIEVNGKPLEAGLDTGSTGLRLMPRAKVEISGGRKAQSYAFGAGVRLEGVIVQTPVAFGGTTARIPVEAVLEVGCTAARPDCPAARLAAGDFAIQGDGLPGEGFAALLGLNTAPADATNPFVAAGVRRWIVELPRPGENGPGRLILDPSDEEAAGYVFAPMLGHGQGGLHDAAPGCLVLGPEARVCAPIALDTGAPGIRVRNLGVSGPVPEGASAALDFTGAGGRVVAAERLRIGLRQHASRLTLERGAGEAAIFAGLSPYFAFSVLYDPEHQRIGLKPRPEAPGGPVGALVSEK